MRGRLSIVAVLALAPLSCGHDEPFFDPGFELADIVGFDAVGYGLRADGARRSLEPLSEEDAGETGGDAAAGPRASFTMAIGGALSEGFQAVVRGNGEVFAAGSTGSFGAGSTDALVGRFQGCGEPVWVRAYGGPGADEAVALAPVGGQLWVGGSHSADKKGLQAWLFRLSEQGEVVVSTEIGGAGYDAAAALVATEGGGAVAAVNTDSAGPGAPTHRGLGVVALNAQGSLLWTRIYGGKNDSNYGAAMAAIPGGGFVVAGRTATWGAGDYDLWLLRLDGSGKFHWSRAYGTTEDDRATSLLLAPDGGFLLAGRTAGFGAKGDDLVVLKVNGGGTPQWSRRIGGAGDESGTAVARAGTSYLVAGAGDSYSDGVDGLVVELGPGGDLLAAQHIGGDRTETLGGVVALPDGSALLAGRTRSVGAGQYDALLVRTEAGLHPGCVAGSIAPAELGVLPVQPLVSPISISISTSTTAIGTLPAVGYAPATTAPTGGWGRAKLCAGSHCAL